MRNKAGLIPYYFKDGKLLMMFRIPSDPRYGGSDPQVAKGNIDGHERPFEAAVREGQEELGLQVNTFKNVVALPVITTRGLDETYHLHMYAVELTNPNVFGPTDFETKETLWMTPAEFLSKGRSNHKQLVSTLVDILKRRKPK